MPLSFNLSKKEKKKNWERRINAGLVIAGNEKGDWGSSSHVKREENIIAMFYLI